MNRCPMNLDARGKRSLVRVKALERWQQGRMDVEHPPAPPRHERGREQPHETRKADDVDAAGFEVRLHRPLERLAILAKSGVIDGRGGNSLRAGAPQSAGLGPVRQ